MKVLIVNPNYQYEQMYKEEGWELVDDLSKADLVQFTGGADVSPELYGCGVHPTTSTNPERDSKERQIFYDAIDRGIPMVGICRGGQLLNVLSGGRMYQNVDGHAIHGTHKVRDTISGFQVEVTSTHHQMMIPGSTARVIGTADPSLCTFKDYVDKEGMVHTVEPEDAPVDVEVVHYPAYKTLCFQPHPEYDEGKACRPWFFSLVMYCLLNDSKAYNKLTLGDATMTLGRLGVFDEEEEWPEEEEEEEFE